MVPGADYPPPVLGGDGQIYDKPLSQSKRSVCYDQPTYRDTETDPDEYFSLEISVDERFTLTNLVIDGTHGTTRVKILDEDGE